MVEDAPPVETIPFDEFSDTAIRYRCPGLNERNTFTIFGSNKKVCANRMSGDALVAGFTHASVFCYTSEINVSTGFGRNCHIRALVDPEFTVNRNRTPHRYCYSTPDGIVPGITQKAKCSTRETPSDFMGFFVRTCRKVVAMPLAISAQKVCRHKILQAEFNPGVQIRRACYFATFEGTIGSSACIRFGKGTPIESTDSTTVNLETFVCKRPASLEFIGLAKKICKVEKPSHLVLQTYVRNVFVCRFTSIESLLKMGQRNCNSPKVSTENISGVVPFAPCRITFTTLATAQRWKCGHIVTAVWEGLTYGRVWGGRPSTNYFFRVSGRMMGKIR